MASVNAKTLGKRKRVVLTFEQKLSILERLKKGQSQESIALEFGIGRATVGDIKKGEQKIRSFASSMEAMDGSSKKRKVMRLAHDEKLDEALYLWFLLKRAQNMPLSGPMLCEKASLMYAQLHNEGSSCSFQASRGWLWRFCQRHGIRNLSLQGEKVSSNDLAIEPFKASLQGILEEEQLSLDQIYNCDETGLCFRMLPSKTLAAKSETSASGMKKQKERVTLMCCSNATGMHKLSLVFIGKSKNPRCFKNVNKKALPVHYYNQKNAWMDSQIFLDWFHNEFVPSVTSYQKKNGPTVKALLLLDNAPSHPDVSSLVSKDGNIKALFLPANTTAVFQPMDQGVMEAVKRRYRKSLLQKLLFEDEEGRSIIEFVKSINMKDVVYMSSAAWEEISPLTLQKSWKKLLSNQEVEESESTDSIDEVVELAQELDTTLDTEEVNDWLAVDNNDMGYQILSDDDIIKEVTQSSEVEDSDEHENTDEDLSSIPTSGEIKEMLDQCLLWYEKQEECTASSLLVLKNIRDLAAKKRYANLKQLQLTHFFKK